MFLQKSGSLGKFYSLLVVHWSVTGLWVKGACVWRRLWIWILWGNVLGSVTGKIETSGGLRSNQVKLFDYIKCFNICWKVTTNCTILWNQTFWRGTLFLHKNKMKQRILQACILKHIIKKGMFSVVGKMNLFGSGMGEFSCFASFNSATIKSFSKHSPRPTLSFKFRTNLFTKHVTNFSKLLYQSIKQ